MGDSFIIPVSSDTFETDGGTSFTVAYGTTIETAGGSGDVVGPASSVDGRPALFDGTTGKLLKVGTVNTAGGLVELDGSSLIPESLIPASIARDTEVTAAVSAHAAATDPHGDRAYAASLGSAYQPVDSDLTAIAALTTTSYGRALLTLANLAALQATLGSGTPSSTTYLRGDGTWSTPASGANYATRTYAQTNLNRFS